MSERAKVKMRQEELFTERGEAYSRQLMLPEICLNVRMGINGSSDPPCDAAGLAMDEAEILGFLRDVLRTWEQPMNDPLEAAFDYAVFEMVETTVKMLERRAQR